MLNAYFFYTQGTLLIKDLVMLLEIQWAVSVYQSKCSVLYSSSKRYGQSLFYFQQSRPKKNIVLMKQK